jgi:hypothetical protein
MIEGQLRHLMLRLVYILIHPFCLQDLVRVASERDKAKKDFQKISRTQSVTRMRESEIRDAKEQSKTCADRRNQKESDPRFTEIPQEIRECGEKVDTLKAEIQDLNLNLSDLRKVAEEQSTVKMLQNQLDSEVDAVKEIIGENSSTFNSRNIEVHPDAEGLLGILDGAVENAIEDLDKATEAFDSYSNNLKDIESRLSKSSAVLNQNKSTFDRRKKQLDILSAEGGGVRRIKQITAACRQFEITQLNGTNILVNTEPQDLLQHFTNKIGELVTDNDQPETISRTMKKLKKMSKKKDRQGNTVQIICPCCTRELEQDEVRVFSNQIDILADVTESPIVQMDIEKAQLNAIATKNYSNWRNTGKFLSLKVHMTAWNCFMYLTYLGSHQLYFSFCEHQ